MKPSLISSGLLHRSLDVSSTKTPPKIQKEPLVEALTDRKHFVLVFYLQSKTLMCPSEKSFRDTQYLKLKPSLLAKLHRHLNDSPKET